MDKEIIICTSCGYKDTHNQFKQNHITIGAIIDKDGEIINVNGVFIHYCAKCSKCGKILFTNMIKYRRLRKEAESYFKKVYGTIKVKLVSIDVK